MRENAQSGQVFRRRNRRGLEPGYVCVFAWETELQILEQMAVVPDGEMAEPLPDEDGGVGGGEHFAVCPVKGAADAVAGGLMGSVFGFGGYLIQCLRLSSLDSLPVLLVTAILRTLHKAY